MLEKGTVLLERYEILERIGSGGMADVYRALDNTLNRYVAIKVLKKEHREDTQFVSKFKQEARAVAVMSHPNIVNVFDVGNEDGIYFIVLELVEGITLKKYIEKKGRLSFKEAVSIAIQIANGISAAHTHHIVHRDIKPQNIIISREGKVKVTDFGIARATHQTATISTQAMGSVHYMSPEQARGGYLDERSDIYSFGVTLFEMLTGDVPFDGDVTVAVAVHHIQDEMAIPSDIVSGIPISIDKIVEKCTKKKVEDRYQSMEDLIFDLKKSLINPNMDFVEKEVKKESPINSVSNKKNLSKKEETTDIDIEDDDNGKINRILKWLGIGIIVGIAIFAAIFIFNFAKGSAKKEDNKTAQEEQLVKIPNVVGLSVKEAKKVLKDAGFEVEVDSEDGVVKKMRPVFGSEAKRGSKVNLFVVGNDNDNEEESKKPEEKEEQKEIELPNLIGLQENEAIAILTAKGLKHSETYENNDSIDKLHIIRMTPSPSTKVKEGDTINLVISNGPKTIIVPNVVGMTYANAKDTILRAGFKYEWNTEDDKEPAQNSIVSKQSPQAGTKMTVNGYNTISMFFERKKDEVKPSTEKPTTPSNKPQKPQTDTNS